MWQQTYEHLGELRLQLESYGFDLFCRTRFRKVDLRLIEHICMRWRPETHTFMFPIEEAAPTLEDAVRILDLRITGSMCILEAVMQP
ncbi:hypothetical protein AMTR_s00096p00098550 [Amborella trichopoda]|uniref:Aminotransferase-like plant mobile domain-containing protein n=1 Tax=Amborella trichopoda TaxID=13333 RepID=W1P5Z5_AMBTC|nr:hypothetical protein AMTR_s00096p00098550 [Amborella trichopoda]